MLLRGAQSTSARGGRGGVCTSGSAGRSTTGWPSTDSRGCSCASKSPPSQPRAHDCGDPPAAAAGGATALFGEPEQRGGGKQAEAGERPAGVGSGGRGRLGSTARRAPGWRGARVRKAAFGDPRQRPALGMSARRGRAMPRRGGALGGYPKRRAGVPRGRRRPRLEAPGRCMARSGRLARGGRTEGRVARAGRVAWGGRVVWGGRTARRRRVAWRRSPARHRHALRRREQRHRRGAGARLRSGSLGWGRCWRQERQGVVVSVVAAGVTHSEVQVRGFG